MIVVQARVVRLGRRGDERVRRERVRVRTQARVRRHEARRREPVEIAENAKARLAAAAGARVRWMLGVILTWADSSW